MSASELVPLYGFVRGDTLGLLIVAHSTERIRDVADKTLSAAAVRISIRGPAAFVYKGTALNQESSVAQAGLSALDRFDLVPVKYEGKD